MKTRGHLVDASGKPADGLLEGTLAFLGAFDECLDTVVWDELDASRLLFQGRYCTAQVAPKFALRDLFNNDSEAHRELESYLPKKAVSAAQMATALESCRRSLRTTWWSSGRRCNVRRSGRKEAPSVFFSGLLVVYTNWKELTESNGRLNVIRFLFNKYWRMAPPLLLSLGLLFLMPVLGDGPFWNDIMGTEIRLCEKSWWSNLLFINNFWESKQMCLVATWYLACNFQFFVISVFILIPLYNPPVAALYAATHRVAWCIALAWLTFACVAGQGGFLESLLSWSPFNALGNLAYMAYLVHPLVILYHSSRTRDLIYYSQYEKVYAFCGHFLITLLLSTLFYVVVEVPFTRLGSMLLRTRLFRKPASPGADSGAAGDPRRVPKAASAIVVDIARGVSPLAFIKARAGGTAKRSNSAHASDHSASVDGGGRPTNGRFRKTGDSSHL
ncbi:hypothetical protein HPB48_003605 [Haemaphysalis longicornis]|uniref:Nose resistant-to-fluoxetine protein N-terminal domain-containing protein n=1 Tax=Haemaphysalis longicornis TaxID=44386 RepID=A0A9J6FEX3_HAELO|nr:hypothetical protein HPB48_003605 [Haemaphysalis longicornis]